MCAIWLGLFVVGSTCFEKHCSTLGRKKEDLRGLKLPQLASEILSPTCVEQESCSWHWWGEISPFGSVSEAWNAVPPSVPTPQGWIFPLLSLASVTFIHAKILPWIFQICIISTNYFLFSFRCKKPFWMADLLSKELFKRSRSSMYCTYYSHALAFVLRL